MEQIMSLVGKDQSLDFVKWANEQITSVATTPLDLQTLKNAVFYYIIYTYGLKLFRHLRARGVVTTASEAYYYIVNRSFKLLLLVPSIRNKVYGQLDDAEVDMQKKIAPQEIPGITRFTKLPEKGSSPEWISDELARLAGMPASDYNAGKVSGAVYHGGEEVSDVIRDAFKKFTVSNPLHPDVFPGVRKMEAEIVEMCLRLFNAPLLPDGSKTTGAGTTTSGGTESILMACKAYRDWGKDVKGITEPEMVVPASIHAAFFKAGDYFGIKVNKIPVDPITRKVNVSAVRRAINSNTVMLAGSAPNFPDGMIDDIPALSALARKHKIPLHVDCCLGSFIVPFLEKVGFPTQPFDFRVDGVTSISCDTHKYGFAPKGSSVIMYRNKTWRKYQYYVSPDWAGGVYASPSIAGSRPGSLLAGTWATMILMGEQGYFDTCKAIVGARQKIEAGIRKSFPELYVFGEPKVTVVAFGSKVLDVYELCDAMSKKGWHLNALQDPPGIHIACTLLTAGAVDNLLADLRTAVDEVKVKGSQKSKGTAVTLYGLGSSSAVGPGLVNEIAVRFLNTLYHT